MQAAALAAALALLAGVFAGFEPALGAAKFGSTVTINRARSGGAKGASGRVRTHQNACLEARKVTLFATFGKDRRTKIGVDRTNRGGGWKVDVPLAPGDHKAVLAKQRVNLPSGRTIVCKGASAKADL